MAKKPVDQMMLLARKRLAERGQAALVSTFWTVRPIFWSGDRDDAELIGSAVLFTVAGRHFLISAAHVLDLTAERTLYVGARESLVPLEGRRKSTTPPGGQRENDKVDLAFIELTETVVKALDGYRFLTPVEIDVNEIVARQPPMSSHYLAIGYPATKVKVNRDKLKVIPEPLPLSGRSLPDTDYTAVGVAEYSHLFIEFDRKRMVSRDGPRTAPNPYGMSGGALFRFNSLMAGADAPNPLVGILTEYHQRRVKGILATRMSLCVQAMRSFYPELEEHLPILTRVRVTTTHI